MSAGSTVRASRGKDSKPDIERARALCAEALEICDALNLPPEIGARIQETISALEQFLKSQQSRGTSG
jgi:hypothetical protein